MKAKHFLLISCIIISLLTISCNEKPESNSKPKPAAVATTACSFVPTCPSTACPSVITTFSTESQLLLEVFPIDAQRGHDRITETASTFSCAGSALIPRIAAISTVALVQLQTIAAAIPTTGCASPITCVRVVYGMKSQGSQTVFVAYYRPVLCCFTGTVNGSEDELLGTYNIIEGANTYSYNPTSNGSFDREDPGTVNVAIKSYTANLKVKDNGAIRTFSVNQDISGDVTSVLFPFQEIFALLIENSSPPFLYLWSGTRLVPYQRGHCNTKHSVLLTPFDLQDIGFRDQTLRTFKNNYSDLGHLCPPSCGTATFRLYN